MSTVVSTQSAHVTAAVFAAVVVSVQLSAMGFPFDGRILEGTYRYFGITDVDRIADVKLMLSPLSAWLVFWIDARIRRARSTKPA